MEKPWKVILAFLGVFVAGAVFGGFFSLGIGRRIWEMETPPATKPVATTVPASQQPPAAAKGGPAPLPPPVDVQRAQLMRRVANQLNLTPAQKTLITPIIQRAVQDIWRQQQNLFRESTYITQRMKQDIAKELTPEQQSRLDELWLKQIELFRKRQAEAQAQARAEAQQKRAGATPPAAGPADKAAPDAAKAAPDAAKPSAPDAKQPGAKPTDGG